MNRRDFLTMTPAIALANKKEDVQFDYLNARTWFPTDPSPINMGMPDPVHEHTFSRQFRFLLDSNTESTLRFWCHSMEIDLINNKLNVSIHDTTEIRNWLDKIDKPGVISFNNNQLEELSLSVLNGLGETLWMAKFSGLKRLEHKLQFSYSSSNEVRHDVVFKFDTYKRKDYKSHKIEKNED